RFDADSAATPRAGRSEAQQAQWGWESTATTGSTHTGPTQCGQAATPASESRLQTLPMPPARPPEPEHATGHYRDERTWRALLFASDAAPAQGASRRS